MTSSYVQISGLQPKDTGVGKRLPAMQETWVQCLGQEDPLEKEMATHSSILPGESHGQRSLVGYSPRGRKESDMTERLHFHFHFRFNFLVFKSYFQANTFPTLPGLKLFL